MHFVLVTLLSLGAQPMPPGQAMPAPMQQAAPAPGQQYGAYDDGGQCDCEACRAKRCNGGANCAQSHMMPQTCYSPRYGCYFGGERHMNRYPAFHGHYYRRPYNYRSVFDYPWHAELHEPTSHFSFNTQPPMEQLPAAPPMAQRQLQQQPQQIQQPVHMQMIKQPVQQPQQPQQQAAPRTVRKSFVDQVQAIEPISAKPRKTIMRIVDREEIEAEQYPYDR